MTSHVVVPRDRPRPAGDVLGRRCSAACCATELGFDGVIVSDALDMAGASGRDGHPRGRGARPRRGVRPALPRVRDDGGRYLDVVEAVVRRGGVGSAACSSDSSEAAARVACCPRASPAGGPGAPGRTADVVEPGWANGALVGGFEVGGRGAPWLDAPGEAVIVQVASDPNLAVGRSRLGARRRRADDTRGRRARGCQVAVAGRGLAAGATRSGRSPIAFVRKDIRRSSSTAAGLAAMRTS